MRFPSRRFLTIVLLLCAAACAHRPSPPAQAASRFAAIDAAIESFIAERQMPGAVFHLERAELAYENAYGRETYDEGAPAVTLDTRFDAASLTKVVVTAPLVMTFIDQGKLSLDAPLSRYLPACESGGKDAITLRHLLTHTSGLPSGIPRAPEWRGVDAALARACAMTVTHPPGAFFRYSDVNYILLGEIVRRVGGRPLDELAVERLFRPLRMTRSGYLPERPASADGIAPTRRAPEDGIEVFLRGEVHDPTARRMGGVAGHAGLFTTVGDLARFARMLLNDGELDGVRVLSRDSVRLMTTAQSPDAVPQRRGAGFDIDSPYSRPRGAHFPVGSYGHTGFTGCILWVDPFSRTFYVFLSNRVYPDDKANILPLYSRLGTLSAEAVRGPDAAGRADARP